jgi:hypothetical protein
MLLSSFFSSLFFALASLNGILVIILYKKNVGEKYIPHEASPNAYQRNIQPPTKRRASQHTLVASVLFFVDTKILAISVGRKTYAFSKNQLNTAAFPTPWRIAVSACKDRTFFAKMKNLYFFS